jgi:hypothetical protein
MRSANRIVGNRRDDLATRTQIWIKSGANSIRREVAYRIDGCPDNRIYGRLN